MSSTTDHRTEARPVAVTSKPAFSQRIDRAARKSHDVLVIRDASDGTLKYVRCPLKLADGRTQVVSASKDRRWLTAGSQIFFECA